MPDPKPGESRQDYMNRCIPQLKKEGRDQKQAVAICESKYDNRNKAEDLGANATFFELIQGKIWAILPEKLDEINDFISHRLMDPNYSVGMYEPGRSGNRASDSFDVVDDIAIIPIAGTIAMKANLMMRMSGGTSIQLLRRDFQAALDIPSVKGIFLDVDSPGGSVDGISQMASMIFQGREQKPIAAFTETVMASAAYWLGSAADVLTASDSARIGSIGVIAMHYDMSVADAQRGVKRTFITAGKYKAMGADNEPLNDEARKYLQSMVDYHYDMFLAGVAQNRGQDVPTVKEDMADGRVFIGKQALKAGLINNIGTKDEAFQALKDKVKAKYVSTPTNVKTTSTGGKAMTREEFMAQHPELYAQIVAEGQSSKVDVDAAISKALAPLQAGMEDLKKQNEILSTANAKLEKDNAIRTENFNISESRRVWREQLLASKIPSSMYTDDKGLYLDDNKVSRQVPYTKYLAEDGTLKVDDFSKAVQAEVMDWENRLPKANNSVLGFGANVQSVEGDRSAQADKADEDWVKKMVAYVPQQQAN